MTPLAHYDSVFGKDWIVGRFLLPELRRLGRDQRGVVLDLGCGSSPFSGCFDVADRYLRIDRYHIARGVLLADMTAIPIADRTIDLVLLSQALSDVAQPHLVLQEVRRVLRPAGRLLVFESMAYPEHDAPNDFFRVMPSGLRFLGAAAGFEVQQCIRLGGVFARAGVLCNDGLLSLTQSQPLLRPISRLGVAATNLLCYALDLLAPHPRLAPDYLAILSPSAEPHDVLLRP